MSSLGIGMVGMLGRLVSWWHRPVFWPGIADELGSGNSISGKEILYHTLISSQIFCSGKMRLFRDIIGHRTESLSHNWGCLVTYPLCVPLTGIRNPSLDSLSVSPSPHRIGKQQQHQQKVVFPKFQNVNRTAFLLCSWDKTWSPNHKNLFKD